MIGREAMIALSAVGVLVVGGSVAWEASASNPAPSQTPAATSYSFASGSRYQVAVTWTMGIPSSGITVAYVQSQINGATSASTFRVVSVAEQSVTVIYVLDALASVSQSAAILAGAVGASSTGGTYTVAVQSLGATPGATPVPVQAAPPAVIPPPAATTVHGRPASPWQTDVILGPDTTDVSAWPGDTISIALPTGAAWRSPAGSLGQATGSSPYTFVYPGAGAAQTALGQTSLNWTDAAGNARTTFLQFAPGRTWSAATHWSTGDTVRLSVTQQDLTNINSSITTAAQNLAGASATISAEVTAIQTGIAALTATGASLTYADVIRILLTAGPWGQAFAVAAQTLTVYAPGATLPSDWPASDSGGFLRVEFLYAGPGVDVNALPFPVTSWVRAT